MGLQKHIAEDCMDYIQAWIVMRMNVTCMKLSRVSFEALELDRTRVQIRESDLFFDATWCRPYSFWVIKTKAAYKKPDKL